MNTRLKKIDTEKVEPKEIRKVGNKELKISWSDGHTSLYPFRWLRQNCQCAMCVDEWSRNQVLAQENVPENIEGLKVNIIGQYALGIDFSDGHRTGIYAFKFLRKICPCKQCRKERESSQESVQRHYLNKEELRKKNGI